MSYAIALSLLLNEATEEAYDMEREDDAVKFAKHLEDNEKTAMSSLVQNFINNSKRDDVSMKLRGVKPKINPNLDCLG